MFWGVYMMDFGWKAVESMTELARIIKGSLRYAAWRWTLPEPTTGINYRRGDWGV
jgi:hypothetical protein